MTTTPRLGAPMLVSGEAVPETTVNEQAMLFDAFCMAHFKDRDLTAPPASPALGDCYLVAATATDAWVGKDGYVATYINTSWTFTAPSEGFMFWVDDENIMVVYDGSAWNQVGLSDSDFIPTSYLDTDGTLAADSDTKVPSQKAVKTYVDDAIADIPGATVPTETIIIACSDESTALTTGTAKVTFRMPYAFTLTAVRASVTTAPTGATLNVDINESGTSVLSTVLTIDASEKTSTTAATAAVISDASLADDAEMTIDIDQVGSTVAGKGLKIYLIGHQ